MAKTSLKIPAKAAKPAIETPPVEAAVPPPSVNHVAGTSSPGEMKLPSSGGVFTLNSEGKLVRE